MKVLHSLTLLLITTLPSIISAMTLLGPKSTANQVYNYLLSLDPNHDQSSFAPYVQNGGTAVITGSSGIGGETIKTLVNAGMTVVVCVRNVKAGNELKQSLLMDQPQQQQQQQQQPQPQDRIDVQYMDLSDLSSVQEAANTICEKYGTIDCLINNAGIMALKQRTESKDGIELQFGTNHVGHHFLTRLLLPNMNQEHGRIINVASTAHTMAREPLTDWESKDSYSPWGAYGKSKLANILFTKQLQSELDDYYSADGCAIKSVCLHPGVIKSPLWKHTVPWFLQPVVGLIANKNLEQGAATTIYCAMARLVEKGAYYDNCAVTEPTATAQSDKLRMELWEYTESLLAQKGFQLPKMQEKAKAAPVSTE
ncbi:unnamed protein product [Cylindrotheca closterium]|uniref:Protochlorophyllide reductase n=1 Tax=Cylindrotheca closterium TaxID=2856 RepID=A0AAD2FXF4_9STRA|nr:unnamed protein product [Cylindrotheca closterium]